MKQRAFDYRLEQNITATRIRRRLEREKPLTYPPTHLSIGGLPLYRRARTPKGLASRDPSQLSLRLCIREGALLARAPHYRRSLSRAEFSRAAAVLRHGADGSTRA